MLPDEAVGRRVEVVHTGRAVLRLVIPAHLYGLYWAASYHGPQMWGSLRIPTPYRVEGERRPWVEEVG